MKCARPVETTVSRRSVLRTQARAAAALLGLISLPARAQPAHSRRHLTDDDPNAFVFSRFRFKGKQRASDEWDVIPAGDENLLRHIGQVTNIKLSGMSWAERVVEIDDFEKLYTAPFLFMTGQVDFRFETDEAEALREYFKRGGFLYADDCDADIDRMLFYEAFTREIQKVVPGRKMEPLPHDHDLYHCFYDIPDGSTWLAEDRALAPRYPDAALFLSGRMVCFLTGSDQHCAWAKRSARVSYYNEAIRLGTNIVVYALTH